MNKKFYNILVTNGTPLTNNNNEYKINGVTYKVTSVFDETAPQNKTISDKVFRIVNLQSAHLMAEETNATIDDEYTCLTAGEEDLCSQ